MSRKKKAPTTPTTSLQTLKIGSRVRCTDDRVEGRIVWANATSVKIQRVGGAVRYPIRTGGRGNYLAADWRGTDGES